MGLSLPSVINPAIEHDTGIGRALPDIIHNFNGLQVAAHGRPIFI